MQEFYLHSVPINPSDVKSADALLQQYQKSSTTTTENPNTTTTTSEPSWLLYNKNHHLHHQYQRLVIVFRRGTYQEYTTDSGRPVTHHELKQAPLQKFMKRSYTFGAIPHQLIEKKLYTRQQLYDMGAHR